MKLEPKASRRGLGLWSAILWRTVVWSAFLYTAIGAPLGAEDSGDKNSFFSSTSWYLYGGTSGGDEDLFEALCPPTLDLDERAFTAFFATLGIGFEEAFDRFSIPLISTSTDSSSVLGLGGTYCFNEHLSLDFGMAYGSSEVWHSYEIDGFSIESPFLDDGIGVDYELVDGLLEGHSHTDVDLLSAHLAARYYPRQGGRLRPWLSAGIRAYSLEPGESTTTVRLRPIDVPELTLPQPDSLETVRESELFAGVGLDIKLNDHFDLSLSGDHGSDFGWQAGLQLVFKVGPGACGRCDDMHDSEDPTPAAEPVSASESKDLDDENCGPFLPGEAPLPRITTPPMTARRPLTVRPGLLPGGAVAHFPSRDSDRFFVRFPATSIGPQAPDDYLDAVMPQTLQAIGFDAGTSGLSRATRLAGPRGHFSPLTAGLELEMAADPGAFDALDSTMLQVMQARKATDPRVEASLNDAFGMGFAELLSDVERPGALTAFNQIIDGTPVEHTLVLASHSPARGASLRGALIHHYDVANEVRLSSPVAAADKAMRAIPGVKGVELPKDGEGPVLVLLPYGSSTAGRIQLRYAYRMILTARFCRQEVPFLLWIDAEDATLLKVEPLVLDLAGSQSTKQAVEAPAAIYNRDPSLGKTVALLRVYPGEQGELLLEGEGLSRPDFQDDGFDDLDVQIAAAEGELGFDQYPFNDHEQAMCGHGTNKQFQQIHFFASLMRYRRYSKALGVDPVFSLAWKPGIESPRAGCSAWSNMSFGACRGYYDPACPNYSDGTDSLENCLNFAHDNTVIGHEMGHNITAELANRRPFNWCGSSKCSLPVGWRSLHDLADFWADHFESTPCVGGWVCKNVGGVDAAKGCKSHSEGSGMPRLHELPLPFTPDAPGDHFPEHRGLAVGEYADMQIPTAALWQLQLAMRSRSLTAGSIPLARRLSRALYKTGFLGFTPEATDLGIYQHLLDLESELMDEWAAAPKDPTAAKVSAAFARAGIFLIPPACLDGDPTTAEPTSCPTGEGGGDAVIHMDDNDPDDDVTIRGVLHPEMDYLQIGGPPPTFHVWTGPRYRFHSDGSASLSDSPPCHRRYRIELATDPSFASEAVITNGWAEIGDSGAGPTCYAQWTPTAVQWAPLQTEPSGTKLYYRVETRDANGDHARLSTRPGAGLWTIRAPYAVLTADGRAS